MGITDVIYNQYQQPQVGSYQKKSNQKAAKNEVPKDAMNGNVQQVRQQRVDRTERYQKTENQLETYDLSKLSKEAKSYLETLKEKYNMADIIVADYSTDEEARAYMAGARKDYAVVITPDLLEKMATEEESKTKYEAILDNAMGDMNTIKEQLGEDADKVSTIGVTIDKDGNAKYFATLDEQRVKDSQRQEKLQEKRTEEKKAKKKQEEKEKREERLTKKPKTVTASSIEELIEKIRTGKTDDNKETELAFAKTAQEEARKGTAVDYSL